MPPSPVIEPPQSRDGGSLLWTTDSLDPAALSRAGWTVYSFHDIRLQTIDPARRTGLHRATLDNPAVALLSLFRQRKPIAVLGVVTRTEADLRDVHGYLVEPAFRAGATLLIGADASVDSLDEDHYVEDIGFPWTLERLRYVVDRYRVQRAEGLPPLTPIERTLFDAMRERGLQPVVQFGVGAYRLDFAFPDLGLGVEADGRPWHEPERDRIRDARLKAKGWEILHFTGSEIHRDADDCVDRIERKVTERSRIQTTTAPIIVVERSLWQRILDAVLRRNRSSVSGHPGSASIDTTVEAASPPTTWLASLDKQQQAAVTAHDGVVQVIAAAGSGKTTVLVARVRELVARGVAPNRILCCTFNRAAALELEKRLKQAGITSVEASTFHALGRQILEDAGILRASIGSTPYGTWRRLAKVAMDETEDGTWIEAPDAQEQISNLKLARMEAPDEYAMVASSAAERTLARLYQLYATKLEEEDRYDFDDLVFESLRLLQRDPARRHKWQARYDAVLVDEYQDIEPAQELLIRIVASPADALFCVGDEDQCLYAWRRATVERVIELDQVYPGLERFALTKNYRSVRNVVDCSRTLITNNIRRFPKSIEAARSEPGKITLVTAAELQAQCRHAARLLSGKSQGQAVVLARTTRVLKLVAGELAHAGVLFFGAPRLKGASGEQAVLLSYLRLFGNLADARDEDVEQVYRVPNRYLPSGAATSIASALRRGLSFTAATDRLRLQEEWRAPRLREGAALFDALANIEDAEAFIRQLRGASGGLDRHYADAEQLHPIDQSQVDWLGSAESWAHGMSVSEFADAMDYERNLVERHFDQKGIELSTIHGAKGREWPMVILVGADDDELPHARSLENATDLAGALEDERRLAYVSFTRAKDELIIMTTSGRPSRFIAEAAPVAQSEIDEIPSPDERLPTSRANGGRMAIGRPVPEERASSTTVAAAPVATLTRTSAPNPGAYRPESPRTGERLVAVPRGDHERPMPTSLIAADDPKQNGIDRAFGALRASKARELPPGAIICSLPGCGGIVTPGFVIANEFGTFGLCGQAQRHERLVHEDRGIAETYRKLRELARDSRRRWAEANRDEWERGQLARGGVPCDIPGCRGIAKPERVIQSLNGPRALCTWRSNHEQLAAASDTTESLVMELEALFGDNAW